MKMLRSTLGLLNRSQAFLFLIYVRASKKSAFCSCLALCRLQEHGRAQNPPSIPSRSCKKCFQDPQQPWPISFWVIQQAWPIP